MVDERVASGQNAACAAYTGWARRPTRVMSTIPMSWRYADGYAVRLDEPPALRRPGRQQDPVDVSTSRIEAVRHVADVDDAVVREHRRMAAGILEEQRIGEEDLERRLRLDRPPEMILEVCAEVAWEVLVSRAQ